MKIFRNLLIATAAVAAISTTAAFAEGETATYTDGTVKVENYDISDLGDQITVVIVPEGTTTVSESNIYYINQDGSTTVGSILDSMGMKDLAADDTNTNFEVWIGGSAVTDASQIIKINFSITSAGVEIKLGDVTLDDTVDVSDINPIIQHILGATTLVDKVASAADTTQDGTIDVSDINPIIQHILGATTLGTITYTE